MGLALWGAAGTGLVAQETQGDAAPLSEEAQAWNDVKQSDASSDVFEFIERYPNGEFSKEAKALMIDLLWMEMAADGPAPSVDASEDSEVTPVTFGAPLTVGAPEIVGRSIEELIAGNPLFPPVEGLPEEFWKEQGCSSCHEWQRANLCDQANTYLGDAGGENLSKQHPYGGSFKLSLRDWAIGGCE